MNSPWFWLSAWVTLVVASVVAHEASHVFAGVKNDWVYGGAFVRLRALGVGVNLNPKDAEAEKKLWLVALAGPVASGICAAIFFVLAALPGKSGVVFHSLFVLNAILLVVNLVPTPITDGGHIVQSVFGKRLTWGRSALVATLIWIACESVAAIFLL